MFKKILGWIFIPYVMVGILVAKRTNNKLIGVLVGFGTAFLLLILIGITSPDSTTQGINDGMKPQTQATTPAKTDAEKEAELIEQDRFIAMAIISNSEACITALQGGDMVEAYRKLDQAHNNFTNFSSKAKTELCKNAAMSGQSFTREAMKVINGDLSAKQQAYAQDLGKEFGYDVAMLKVLYETEK